jgi:cytoskeletal protein CcmA (bactofilin family)
LLKVEGKFFIMGRFDGGPDDNKDSKSDPGSSTPVVTVTSENLKSVEAMTSPPRRAAAVSAATPVDTGLVGHLYKGSRVSGQLMFQGAARIDGYIEGEIQCQGVLTIGEGAEVRAKISGEVVVIRGKVEGNVTANEKVELLSPARVVGNISAPRLTITEGVVFDGDCSMGVVKQKSGVASAQAISADKSAPASTLAQQSDSQK